MGVSVEGGKGRGKSMMVDLNLVPFIDFLTCLVAFLMATAVWAEIHALPHEQLISPPDPNQTPPETPPTPPLTVHVEADGIWMGRKVEEGTKIPRVGELHDYAKFEELLTKDKETNPTDDQAVTINTDDGVKYEEMLKVFDLTRKHGYPKQALAGGPPSPDPVPGAPGAAPAGG